MSGGCAFDCRHPLWGGAGECIAADDPTVDDSCVCDEGYASSDSFGNPSCVPVRVLLGVYTTVALVVTMTAALTLWHLAHHFFVMTESARNTPKAVVRLRLIISSSVTTSGVAVVFWSAVAGRGAVPLFDGGSFVIMFWLTIPSAVFGAVQLGEMWLDHLPPQLVHPGSTLAKLKTLAKERSAAMWGGFLWSGSAFVFSTLSSVFGQRSVRHVLHLVMAGSTSLSAIVFISVAVYLTRAINRASAKSRQSWHSRAKRNIRVEAGSLTVAAVVYTAGAIMLELTHAGGCTPLIPYAAMATVSTVCLATVVHTSKPAAGKPARSAPTSSPATSKLSQVVSSRLSAIFVKISPTLKKALGGENGGKVLTPRTTQVGRSGALPDIPEGAARGALKHKVIPAVTEDPGVPFAVERTGTESFAEPRSLP